MTDLRQAAQRALEALKSAAIFVDSFRGQKATQEAITALRKALEQPEQEPVASEYIGLPVAYQYLYPDGEWRCSYGDPINGSRPITSRALYARKDGK